MTLKKISLDDSIDFTLIGISSSLADYQLAFHLGNLIGIDFILQESGHQIKMKSSDEEVKFEIYMASSEATKNVFLLINNKLEGNLLLPQFTHFDFLLKIKGAFPYLEYLTEEIKNLKNIYAVSEFKLTSKKDIEKLHYEPEDEIEFL